MADRSLSRAEQEIVIGKCADESHYTVYSSDPVWTRRLRPLADDIGARTIQHQGGTKFFFPVDAVIVSVRKRPVLSEETRAANAARLRALRAEKAH